MKDLDRVVQGNYMITPGLRDRVVLEHKNRSLSVLVDWKGSVDVDI